MSPELFNAIGFWLTFIATFGSLSVLTVMMSHEKRKHKKTQSKINYAIWGLMDSHAHEVDRLQLPKIFAWWIVQHAKETTIEPHNMARGMRQLANHISDAETKQIILDYAQECEPVIAQEREPVTV